MEKNSELPITFTSHTLAPAEKYSQVGLAIAYAVRKFCMVIIFTKFSDHQPLKYLFSESRQVPAMASSRIQRWALTLSTYEYSIQYRPGTTIANADALSRLPLEDQPADKDIPMPGDVNFLVQQLSVSIVTASQIASWTEKDVMSRVHHFIRHGWPDCCPDPSFQPFYNR